MKGSWVIPKHCYIFFMMRFSPIGLHDPRVLVLWHKKYTCQESSTVSQEVILWLTKGRRERTSYFYDMGSLHSPGIGPEWFAYLTCTTAALTLVCLAYIGRIDFFFKNLQVRLGIHFMKQGSCVRITKCTRPLSLPSQLHSPLSLAQLITASQKVMYSSLGFWISVVCAILPYTEPPYDMLTYWFGVNMFFENLNLCTCHQ